ncbi:MAG: ArsR family transcriptional regulator, partial [Limibacillus sp.]
MRESATRASGLLKALSHENRLLILCMLAEGEKAVTELERE